MAAKKKAVKKRVSKKRVAKKKRVVKKRVGTSQTKRSQTTKKPPTKRLKARRKKNVKSGYYPNPKKRSTKNYRIYCISEGVKYYFCGFRDSAANPVFDSVKTKGVKYTSRGLAKGSADFISRNINKNMKKKIKKLFVSAA